MQYKWLKTPVIDMDYWKLYCKIKTECKDDRILFNERIIINITINQIIFTIIKSPL